MLLFEHDVGWQVVDARNLKQQLADTRENGAVNEAYLQIAFAVGVSSLVNAVPYH